MMLGTLMNSKLILNRRDWIDREFLMFMYGNKRHFDEDSNLFPDSNQFQSVALRNITFMFDAQVQYNPVSLITYDALAPQNSITVLQQDDFTYPSLLRRDGAASFTILIYMKTLTSRFYLEN
ncbi:hypothetical protein EVAR_64239_1 [Eumeta japonica]|uniref:Uncharacterized protein n=1 Tax=Eumeta variegata TaxID=151549 RepID=A0A4C1ZC51_EUMVA|nr:hypothetical protein EVAR_64239_1 [Eumeta japonica]